MRGPEGFTIVKRFPLRTPWIVILPFSTAITRYVSSKISLSLSLIDDSDADSAGNGLLQNFLNPCQGIPLLMRRISLSNPAQWRKFRAKWVPHFSPILGEVGVLANTKQGTSEKKDSE